MSLWKLRTIVAAGSIVASWATAQEWYEGCEDLIPLNSHQTHRVQNGDTLSCIANKTWNTVAILLEFNQWLQKQHQEKCKGKTSIEWWFCDTPEDTIFPWNVVQIPWSSSDISWQLVSSWISPEEAKEILPLVEEWILKFPWLSSENAVAVVSKLYSIPKSANVWLLLDVSWSANDDRELIAWFTSFFLNDRKLAWNVIDETWETEIGITKVYEYWDSWEERTIYWINNAYWDWADYVVVITDEPWDGSWKTISKNTTTIFMIQDTNYCPDKCWDVHPYENVWNQALSEHWEVVYLQPSEQ